MVLYGSLSILIFAGTFWETVYIHTHNPKASVYACFFLILMYTLVSLLGIIVTGFLSFHIYLMLNNMTTIEFCEKKRAGSDSYKQESPWKLTPYQNISTALGPRACLWFLPVQTKELEDGLYFDCNEELMRLTSFA